MHQDSDYQPSGMKHFSQPSVKESVLKPIPQVSAYLIRLQRLFKSLPWRKSSWRRRSQAQCMWTYFSMFKNKPSIAQLELPFNDNGSVTFTDGDYGKSITWRLSPELDGKDVAWCIFADSLRTTESTAQQLFRLVLAVTPIPVGKHACVCVCVLHFFCYLTRVQFMLCSLSSLYKPG